MTRKRRLRTLDWDAVGGLVAAVLAVGLHLLNLVQERFLLVIVTSLLALLLFRDLREETATQELAQSVADTERRVAEVRSAMTPPQLELVGPDSLRRVSRQFGRDAEGDLVWFNLCLLMVSRRETFDVLVRPAVENPDVSALQFVLDESQRGRWESDVEPLLAEAVDDRTSVDVHWRNIDESVAFIHTASEGDAASALVSFWGEPFMAETLDRDVTRYILHAKEHSELIPHLRELARRYRLQSTS
ncbi:MULTISPECIES: hypothetical protein [Halorussus]|uniref:hypothetical protein n=1 Tax=Halorussus TaxID=1070314 RepID=UPI00209E4697|nr:hypothetical protein [Halorussus vallis]USZ77072.1 hypothetical protein NGM07_07030 [Halorussus vallis]